MLGTYEAVLVLYKDKLILEQRGGQVLFFHPDTAMLRIKSGRDPLLELLGKEKQSIIDCTMSLGSDSIVLASAGHRVTALESSKLVHFIVSRGLQDFDSGLQEVNRAMKSIQTIWTDSLTYLKEQKISLLMSFTLIPCFRKKSRNHKIFLACLLWLTEVV